jgi:hypothetical protein
MNRPDLFIYLSVWLALFAWAVGEVLQTQPGTTRGARRCWFAGSIALAIHVGLAMHFHHDWSHAAAVTETARQTADRFGLSWGGGVWFNYALVAWWLADAARARVAPTVWLAPSPWRAARRTFFLFMWFNAAVVFPTGTTRWLGAVVCGVVVIAWLRERWGPAAGDAEVQT